MKRFRDYNPLIFQGIIDAKVVEDWIREDWIREMEKCSKIMKCTSEEKLLLAKFSLKNEAQISGSLWVMFIVEIKC